MSQKLMLGHKVRRLRRESGLSQVQMAEQLGISPSYLNLIEHNQRPVTLTLLLKLGQNFGIDLQRFAEDDEARLVSGLSEVLTDALFRGTDLGKQDLRELAAVAPGIAEAMTTLYGAYAQARQELEAIADAAGSPDLARLRASPGEAARDFFQGELNHFPELETAAEDLWGRAALEPAALYASLARYLETTHRFKVQLMPQSIMGPMIRRHDPHRGRVLLSEMLPTSGRVFQLACEVAILEQGATLDRIVARLASTDEDARALARIGLINYFAGAVLLPYAAFAAAAQDLRHDLAVLSARFGASFEQVCHRLTTLQRPGAAGVPFFMIRIDAAGNVSKRFSANSLHFARFGGACPIWNLHHAFQAPGRILTQLAEMPDGSRYLSIARTVSKPWRKGPLGAAQYAIALGCEARHAERIVYADGLRLEDKDAADPIGMTCRTCPRGDCAHRAFPSTQQPVPKTDFIRTDPLFATP
ncbi:MAG TPA: short-chain fatty acyl-CoA regulator family protein [Stellaceae bacterium]|nr:short-chain fatty acyl-CoA regulator family protein [Stellaceae bacterium]